MRFLIIVLTVLNLLSACAAPKPLNVNWDFETGSDGVEKACLTEEDVGKLSEALVRCNVVNPKGTP